MTINEAKSILEIDNSFYDEKSLKKQYHKLLHLNHPDNFLNDKLALEKAKEKTTLIIKAFEVLNEDLSNSKTVLNHRDVSREKNNNLSTVKKIILMDVEILKREQKEIKEFLNQNKDFFLKYEDKAILILYFKYKKLLDSQVDGWYRLFYTKGSNLSINLNQVLFQRNQNELKRQQIRNDITKKLWSDFLIKYIYHYLSKSDKVVKIESEFKNDKSNIQYKHLKDINSNFIEDVKIIDELCKKMLEVKFNELRFIFDNYKNYTYYDKVETDIVKLKTDIKNEIVKVVKEYKNGFRKEKSLEQVVSEIISSVSPLALNVFKNYINHDRCIQILEKFRKRISLNNDLNLIYKNVLLSKLERVSNKYINDIDLFVEKILNIIELYNSFSKDDYIDISNFDRQKSRR